MGTKSNRPWFGIAAVFLGFLVAVCVFAVLAWSSARQWPPEVGWVRVPPPSPGGYGMWLPCARYPAAVGVRVDCGWEDTQTDDQPPADDDQPPGGPARPVRPAAVRRIAETGL